MDHQLGGFPNPPTYLGVDARIHLRAGSPARPRAMDSRIHPAWGEGRCDGSPNSYPISQMDPRIHRTPTAALNHCRCGTGAWMSVLAAAVHWEIAVLGATIFPYAPDRRQAAVTDDGTQEARDRDERSLPPIPATPTVPRSQLIRGRPHLLAEYGLRHSLGWQDHRTTGPSFVVVRLSRIDKVKVTSRFPLTDQGWESAWRTLSGLDADAAAAVSAQLAVIETRRNAAATLAELDARTVCRLRRMTYNGGSNELPLAREKPYDLRFLGDRLMVCPPSSADALVELPYHDVEAVEVSGSDRSRSPSEPVAVILGIALVGALLGLVLLGVLGLILGGLICGLIAAAVMASSTKIETTVRLRSQDAELFFLNTEKAADAVRIELSGPLTAIERARTARPGGSGEPADRASDSIPEQLSKLASLLADGVLSRDEFERLKAKVIDQS